jgi:hypothetical protein
MYTFGAIEVYAGLGDTTPYCEFLKSGPDA